MSFRLRHRAKFDTEAVATALNLRTPRVRSPPQWNWAWPLDESESESSAAPNTAARKAWVSAVHTVAVADDATAIAFVSHDEGRVALLTQKTAGQMSCRPLMLAREIEWDPIATSVTFFNLALEVSATAQSLVAVGYKSGNIAIFDVATAGLLATTRPAAGVPVRRLRFYPAFHLLTSGPVYPEATSNAGLFAVLGLSGALARFPATEISALLAQASSSGGFAKDQRGGGWVVWNISAQDAVLDAAVCGSDPSSICELDISPPAAPLRIAAAGVSPPIAAFTVTSDPAFSARDAAKRAATTVFSAARGFLLSRITTSTDVPSLPEDDRKAITGIARFGASWADDATFGQPLINFSDVRDTARKSVAAVLTRGRKPLDIDGATAIETYRRLSKGGGFANQIARARALDVNAIDSEGSAEAEAADIMRRQRSRFGGEEVANTVRVPQNARVIERIAAAPLPCSLIATSDTLGRVFIQDPRDLCILRVLKGYREGQIAWLAEGGPLLVVYAPRLNALELHEPLDLRRVAAFALESGSMIVQSTSYNVFCVSAEGNLHQLAKTRKDQTRTSTRLSTQLKSLSQSQVVGKESEVESDERNTSSEQHFVDSTRTRAPQNANVDYDSVGTFLEAVKSSQTSVAVDCLQRNEDDVTKVAHLMATLVTCTQYIRTEVHIALASKAAQVAANLQSTDLKLRFEAHGKLAEAFGLLVAEVIPEENAAEERRVSKYGHRLLEDEVGSGLVEFAVEELTQKNTRADGRRMRARSEEEAINCERFILCHELEPTTDLRSELEYVLTARQDLSSAEEIWLAKAYFSRLLEVDPMGVPVEGREHPTTKDVFFALSDLLKLTDSQITIGFITFFLNMPLLTLLNTHSSEYASPLRCAILRMQEYFSREEVEATLMSKCETTARIPNAVLLLRLYGYYENVIESGANKTGLEGCLDRLEEVLLYRRLVAGSAIPASVYEKFTAKLCTGVPGDAERHAVTCLIEWNDFDRASKILMGLDVSRKRHSLEWHESASVSEAALHACRKKSVDLITEATSKVLPEGVVKWILAITSTEKQPAWEMLLETRREQVLRELAEAMSAMIELEVNGDVGDSNVTEANKCHDGQNVSVGPSEQQEDSAWDDYSIEAAPQAGLDKMSAPAVSNAESLKEISASRAGLQDVSDMEMETTENLNVLQSDEPDDEEFHDASSEPPDADTDKINSAA